jgi:hypothetical protein
MKRILITLLGAVLLTTPALRSQPAEQPSVQAKPDALVRFDLDFPGGTPRQLIEAIEKASGKRLNAIIPAEYADFKLPPLRMKNVNVVLLFNGLERASRRTVMYATRGAYNSAEESYGFRSEDPPRGTRGFGRGGGPELARPESPVTDETVWYFFVEKAPKVEQAKVEQAKTCRFYQLAPYLETYKVEDITTAIQTGWKMLGESNPPTISFHKDTKLLIAVGEESKLQLIDSVLQQLAKRSPPLQREPSAKTAEPAKE